MGSGLEETSLSGQHTDMFKVLVSEESPVSPGHTSQPAQLADERYNSYLEKFPQNGLQ